MLFRPIAFQGGYMKRKVKDFSDPHKLGFLRVIEVLMVFNIIFTLVISVFYIKEYFQLDFDDALDYINLIFDGICLWLVIKRKREARVFVMVFTLFNIAVGSSYHMGAGTFSLVDQLTYSFIDIILFLYFATSKRVKAQLTGSLVDEEEKSQEISADRALFQPKTWPFWRNLIIYFCVFSVVGHWMEAAYCTLIRFGLIPGTYDPNSQIWSDWLYPFMVYGVGAVACVLLLYPIKTKLESVISRRGLALTVSFVINALVCTLIELVMGLMLNQPGPDGTLPLWDYSNMFMNFMGQVCLQNALAFGAVSTAMTWLIYPMLEQATRKVPSQVMQVVFVGVVIGFAILMALYYINIAIPELIELSTAASA